MLSYARTRFAAITLLASMAAMPASAQTLLHSYNFTSDASDGAGNADGVLIGGSNISSGILNLDGTTGYVQFTSDIVPTSGSYSVTLTARQSVEQNDFTELISQGFSGGPGFYIGTDPSHVIRVGDEWETPALHFPRMVSGTTMH